MVWCEKCVLSSFNSPKKKDRLKGFEKNVSSVNRKWLFTKEILIKINELMYGKCGGNLVVSISHLGEKKKHIKSLFFFSHISQKRKMVISERHEPRSLSLQSDYAESLERRKRSVNYYFNIYCMPLNMINTFYFTRLPKAIDETLWAEAKAQGKQNKNW